MIDARCPLYHFRTNALSGKSNNLFEGWKEDWRLATGRGVVIGLLDALFDPTTPDLCNADLITRSFCDSSNTDGDITEHGTHSVTTLVGQGKHQIRGIVPDAQLLVAQVVDSNGKASPDAVVSALEWLIASGAQVIALPLGESIERWEITQQMERGNEQSVIFFAAAGNSYPQPVVFPARHPVAIAVGAADWEGNLLPECNRLPHLDIIMPGLNIAAPVRSGIVSHRRGSSVACILAAGVTALALSCLTGEAERGSRASILAMLLGADTARAPPRFEE